MSRTLKTLPVMACALVLAGCANPFGKEGYFRDKSGDYTKAEVTEPLTIPDNMNHLPMGDALAIPEINQAHGDLSEDFVVPRPDQRLTQKQGSVYSIERDGDQQWILAGKSPSEIWPRVLAFIEENEVSIAQQNVKQGFLETQWADLGRDKEHGFMVRTIGKLVGVEDIDPMEDRFRIEVRQGMQADSTEIFLQHKGRPLTAEGEQPAAEPENWNNLEVRSQRLNNAVLDELLLFLVEEEDERSVSYLAQDLDVGSLVTMDLDGNGNPLLRIDQLSYARSWAAVSEALASGGVNVVDRNRSAGIFYIQTDSDGTVGEPEEKPGFFAGLFGSDEADEEVVGEVLHMRVHELNGVVRVSVEKDANTSAPVDISNRLLNLVRDNLK